MAGPTPLTVDLSDGRDYENEEPYLPEYEETAFDEDAVYFGGEDDLNDDLEGFEDDPSQMAESLRLSLCHLC